MNNIILIGMPGSGKSTAGVLLAKTLGMDFTDTDLLLQTGSGMFLREMIDKYGIDGFVRAEEETVLSLRCDRRVIATGGSVVYGEAAMAYLKKMGTVVYLSVPFEEIEKRLFNIKSRGIAIPSGTTLRELYDTRVPLYRKYADITAKCPGGGVEKTVLLVKALLGDRAEDFSKLKG